MKTTRTKIIETKTTAELELKLNTAINFYEQDGWTISDIRFEPLNNTQLIAIILIQKEK